MKRLARGYAGTAEDRHKLVSVAPFSVATAPVDDPLQDWQKAANLIRKV